MNLKKLIGLRHGDYTANQFLWKKWRLATEGGDCFKNEYLKRYSSRESNQEFRVRREITTVPAFAKSAVVEIRNSIFQRMAQVVRTGGSKSYQKAVAGEGAGVDLSGTSLTTFLGQDVLLELLTMKRVGVFIDMPPTNGTLRDAKTPYLYPYRTEEIFTWAWSRPKEYQAVLLCDYTDHCDCETGLPDGRWKRHRYCWMEDGVCHVIMANEDGVQVDLDGNPTDSEIIIDLPYIPFFTMEISDSLMSDIADHQIALLNLESSDNSYLIKSNFPFYTEQVDDRPNSQYLKDEEENDSNITVGNTAGRKYGKDLDRPDFIHPSPEPVLASMEKQKRLKEDIRVLVNLSLSNIQPKMASAESRGFDERGLESGLSYIGLELERAERVIAKIWADYERSEPATIKYPENWALQTEENLRKDAENLEELRDTVPSKKFQKLVSKQIAHKLLGAKISSSDLEEIFAEIDKAETITANPETVFQAVEQGILDAQNAAVILGFPKDAPKLAADEHAARLARIQEAQSQGPEPGPEPGPQRAAARGVPDLSGDPAREGEDEKQESRNTDTDGEIKSKVRGKADG